MSIYRKAPEFKVTPERIEEIMKAAHRERAEYIGQLFGFGFTVVKDAVRNAFGHKTAQSRGQATDAASRG